jgi:Nuclease-related domain
VDNATPHPPPTVGIVAADHDYVCRHPQIAQSPMQAYGLLSLVGDLGLNDEKVDIAMRAGLAPGMRSKQHRLRIGSSSSQPAPRLGDQCLVNHVHSWNRNRCHGSSLTVRLQFNDHPADGPGMVEHEIDLGTAGASARREHERRRAKREAATRERHPHIGNLLLRLQSPPASEVAWDTGAAGEEALGAHLSKRCPHVIVLHDRRIPRSRANIDHLAVAPSGVYVIDAKRYKGKIEVRKPFFGGPRLLVAGRDKSKLVEGLARQREAVRAALAEAPPPMPVHACFCFLNPAGQAGGSGLPVLRTLRFDDLPLYYPRRLSKRLNMPGTLSDESRREIVELLTAAFPRA